MIMDKQKLRRLGVFPYETTRPDYDNINDFMEAWHNFMRDRHNDEQNFVTQGFVTPLFRQVDS